MKKVKQVREPPREWTQKGCGCGEKTVRMNGKVRKEMKARKMRKNIKIL